MISAGILAGLIMVSLLVGFWLALFSKLRRLSRTQRKLRRRNKGRDCTAPMPAQHRRYRKE